MPGPVTLRETPIKQAPRWLTGIVREEEFPKTNQTFLHIDLVLKCIESGVFYCPAFFRGGNNDPASAFVL